MKNLFFIIIAFSIFTGISLSAEAQPTVNIEKLQAESQQSNATKKKNTVSATNSGEKSAGPSFIEKCSSIQFKYAMLLDMDIELLSNAALYEKIEKWWATRYRYGGTTERGIDCSAYTGTLLADVYGLSVSRTARAQYAECEKIPKEDLVEGDLVFFNTGRGISHVGLYLGNGYFTHSGSSTGVTISHLDESYWSRKYRGGGRIIPPTVAE